MMYTRLTKEQIEELRQNMPAIQQGASSAGKERVIIKRQERLSEHSAGPEAFLFYSSVHSGIIGFFHVGQQWGIAFSYNV